MIRSVVATDLRQSAVYPIEVCETEIAIPEIREYQSRITKITLDQLHVCEYDPIYIAGTELHAVQVTSVESGSMRPVKCVNRFKGFMLRYLSVESSNPRTIERPGAAIAPASVRTASPLSVIPR